MHRSTHRALTHNCAAATRSHFAAAPPPVSRWRQMACSSSVAGFYACTSSSSTVQQPLTASDRVLLEGGAFSEFASSMPPCEPLAH